MLLNPTGGLVGGDFSVYANRPGSRYARVLDDAVRDARLSHSAQPAVQETRIQVGEGASLEYLPDHVIPYRDSKLRQSLRVEMGRGSRAIFWDALAAGRVAHGERWNFHEVDSRMEISLRGRTVFLNRTRIRPADLDPERLGFAEGFNYLATLVIVADEFERLEGNGRGDGRGA